MDIVKDVTSVANIEAWSETPTSEQLGNFVTRRLAAVDETSDQDIFALVA